MTTLMNKIMFVSVKKTIQKKKMC